MIGKNIPHDLAVEHSSNYNKQGFGNLGVNLTEKTVARICHAEKPVSLIGKVGKRLQRFIRSAKHVQRSPVVDIDELVKKLMESVFSY